MNRSEDSVMEGGSDIAILDQQVLGVLWEVRSFEDADGWSTVRLERCRARLSIAKSSQISAIELDIFRRNSECVAL